MRKRLSETAGRKGRGPEDGKYQEEELRSEEKTDVDYMGNPAPSNALPGSMKKSPSTFLLSP